MIGRRGLGNRLTASYYGGKRPHSTGAALKVSAARRFNAVTAYADRLQRLQSLLREQGAKLAVLSWSDQMRYLIGAAEHGHKRFLALFVPAEGQPALVVPALNREALERNPGGVRRVAGWTDSEGWEAGAGALLREYGLQAGDICLVDDELYAVHLLGLQALKPGVRWLPADQPISRLRSIKSPDELAALRRAAELVDRAGLEAIAALREAITEQEMQEVVRASFRNMGAQESFTPLICFGENCAMPHHDSDETPLRRGDLVVIDIGCTWDHYRSDITRTVSFGEPADADARRVYSLVSRAHLAGIAAARPGVTCEEVDRAARQMIEAGGYGPQFIHRTGHGIGLSGHEPPYILEGNATPLAPGMCFSVEPGIYLPGRFGVRIENIVTVTHDGCRSLNAAAPTELQIV